MTGSICRRSEGLLGAGSKQIGRRLDRSAPMSTSTPSKASLGRIKAQKGGRSSDASVDPQTRHFLRDSIFERCEPCQVEEILYKGANSTWTSFGN